MDSFFSMINKVKIIILKHVFSSNYGTSKISGWKGTYNELATKKKTKTNLQIYSSKYFTNSYFYQWCVSLFYTLKNSSF